MQSLHFKAFPMHRHHRGFTLIELMVVVAVIAIIAAIALPNFQEQVRKSRRSDALAQAGQMQLALARWRADCPTYANQATCPGTYPALPTAANSPNYGFALTVTASTYTLTATPQAKMNGDRCGALTATHDTAQKPSWATNDNCT